MSLSKIRKKIDGIDLEILEKINERMELALKTGEFKKHICDQRRESQILERIKKYVAELPFIESDFAERIFAEFIKESRRLQDEENQ